MRAERIAPWVAAAVLIVVHIALVLHGANRHSAVFDEVVYPTSGYAYLTTGDYRMNREHPPLLKLLSGAAWLGTGLDAAETPGWREGDQWKFGKAMIHAGGAAQALLMRARFTIALMSVVLALGVFLAARRLGGEVAALVGLALYSFDPLVVAHAGYATTDLGGAALYFWAAVTLPRALEGPSRWNVVLAGLLTGAALTAKFSNLPILVIAGLITGAVMWKTSRSDGWKVTRAIAVRGLMVLLLAALVVTVAYGTSGPDQYFAGLRMLGFHNEVGHPAFAFGQYASSGSWWYFPAAWAVKTPIPILVMTLPGVAMLAIVLRRDVSRLLAFIAAPALILIAAMGFGLNIGVRHLLPLTPFFAVAGGTLAAWAWSRGLAARALLIALLAWLAAGTIAVHPDETAYANEAAGGPDRLWTRLSDSNVDWGQDLPALAKEIQRQPLRRVYLGYFGTAEPHAYGIPYCWIPSMGMVEARCQDGPDPEGREWIAMSVTNLVDVYSSKHQVYEWLRDRPFTAFPGRSIALFDITGDAAAHARLGAAALTASEPAAAEAPLRRAIALAPDAPSPYVLLASALSAQGKSEEAVAMCDRAAELDASGEAGAACTSILAPQNDSGAGSGERR